MSLEQNLRELERVREAYWLRHPGTSPTKLRWRAVTVRHAFHVLPGESILELGAGSGLWTSHLSEVLRGENPITAAVLNQDLAVRAAAKKIPGVDVVAIDDLAADLPAESFDYVVGTAILCHDEHGANLKALHRLLRPGGQLLFFEANFWNPQVLAKTLIPPLGRWAGHARCQIGMRRYRLLQEASRQGFTEIEIIPYDILHPRTPRRLIPAVQATAYFLEQMPAIRELCGTLYIWAKKPGNDRAGRTRASLAGHQELRDSTTVVVPCRNEATTIPNLVSALIDYYGDYIREIILVDDSSEDETPEVAQSVARDEPRVKLLRRVAPPGVGGALRDGFAAASGDYVLSMDCDFALIVPELRELFDAVATGRDGAVGSRFSHDSILVNYPLAKIVANRAFHLLLRLLLRVSVRDLSNNLKLYRSAICAELSIQEDGFAANAEIGLQALLAGHDIAEVPVSWIGRTPDMGRSSFQILRAGPGYVRVLLRAVARRYAGGGQVKGGRGAGSRRPVTGGK